MTEYDTWLRTLGTRRADMPVSVRNLPVAHVVTYPGNVTTATLAGAVKAAPDATAELAVFTVGTPSFSGGVTTWAISLTGTQTGGLPADTDGNGETLLIYDFLLTLSGGSPERMFGGLFPLSGFVTEPA
jgi:hypothetical protein